MKFDNSYYRLGAEFYQQIKPTPVGDPTLFLWNSALAQRLELENLLHSRAEYYFSGNELISGSQPLAQVYAGHQFGGFNPQLGDGRAHLLGEIVSTDKKRWDIQLKGSGQTRFSRRGDGRCALKPALREYIMSEAMYALGVPTTRTLAVVSSGEFLHREGMEPGAIVTRIASSHIRVGTFQYFAMRGDIESLSRLLDYTIERHFPEIAHKEGQKVLLFLQCVIDKQIETLVHWMRVGFIHGVLNTDNTAISGETIDYGPCAMLGQYHPETVYSSIDQHGRYCFGNQPAIIQWNMARLAECFIPLLGADRSASISQLEKLILSMTDQYKKAYYQMMAQKLGIVSGESQALVDHLLNEMQQNKLDYTQTFSLLTEYVGKQQIDTIGLSQTWLEKWFNRVNTADPEASHQVMVQSNPIIIPRNHHVERVLERCKESGCNQAALDYLKALESPYCKTANTAHFQDLPLDGDANYQTFCGT